MIIRAHELREGDIFRQGQVCRKVYEISDKIYHTNIRGGSYSHQEYTNLNSQERIELIERSDFNGQSTLRAGERWK